MERNILISRIFTGLCLLILILPLINLPPWFSPPEWGKSIAFRVLFSLVVMLLFFLMLGQNRVQLLEHVKQGFSASKPGLLLLGGLFLAFLLASLFSFDLNFSLWGNPVRGGGSVTFLSLIAASFLAFVFFSQKNWKYAWYVVLATASLISLVAIFQWQGWFSSFLTPRVARPMSTLGNDIQLGIYLILSLFPVLVFLLKERIGIKKALYFLAFLLFLFVILLTGSRGAYLGIFLGFSFFILLYPAKKLFHSLSLKLLFLLVMLIPALSIYYVNTHRVFPKFVQENKTLYVIAERLQLQQFIVEEPRFSTWKVGWEAIKEKPIFGYGPENFEIGFDRHYDPKFPNIQYEPQSSNSWWDRAHNVLVDTGVQAGVPALLFYLAFLGVLFWRLQKMKIGENALPSHGLQATLIAYLGALFFGFDNFSTLLAFFFLAAYILHITSKEGQTPGVQEALPQQTPGVYKAKPQPKNRFRIPAMAVISILLLAFNWQYGIKPFLINSHVQTAKAMVEKDLCKPAFSRMEKALKRGSTFIDAYVKTTYFDALRNCQTTASETLELAQKGRILLKEAAKAWPFHTRTWIFLGQVTTIIAERDTELTPQEKEDIVKEAQGYFERAKELSLKHQEIYLAWTKLLLVAHDYEGMLKKAEECVAIDPRTGECWFLQGLAHEFLGRDNEFRINTKIALGLGYNADKDFYALSNILQAYAETKDLGGVAKTYEKIIALRPSPQFYASLAFTYRELGEYAKARETALKVIELDPSTKAEVDEFLRTLP
ncbi:MAG: O-antigen ligase family protein [Candidatus Wildermuthbacteria bacterium]|nr:O-antigen ligase family protein [Candidatus Wildermuthbacteria bacterium]